VALLGEVKSPLYQAVFFLERIKLCSNLGGRREEEWVSGNVKEFDLALVLFVVSETFK
jgi:hypothetical protein